MRPLGLGEILDAAIKLVRRRVWVLVGAMLIVTVPTEILRSIVHVSTTSYCDPDTCVGHVRGARYVSDDGAYAAGLAVNAFLLIIRYVLPQVTCFWVLAQAYLDRDVGIGESLRFALRRSLSSLWLAVLVGLGTLVAFVFFVIPGVYLLVGWSVALPVMLVEDRRGTAAMGRSRDLVGGRWWNTFGIFLVAYLMVSIISFALGAVIGGVLISGVVDSGSDAGVALTTLANIFASTVTTPLIAAVAILVYFDLRVRKEGFDLVLLAERMGGGSALAPPPPSGAAVGSVPPPT